jgi:hypothetical protein
MDRLTLIRQHLANKYKLILYNEKILDHKYDHLSTRYLKLKKNRQLPVINYNQCEWCQ